MSGLRVESSDNGNEFLCLNCKYCSQRSGRMNERQIFCGHPELGNAVPFRVTQCDGFASLELWEAARQVVGMVSVASYISLSQDTGRMEILSPSIAKDRDLDREVNRAVYKKFGVDLHEVG